MTPVSKKNALKQYEWGAGCRAWNLVDEPGVSVKQELMPSQTAEALHLHRQAQQFFFIIHGVALFEIENQKIVVNAGEGIRGLPGEKHRVINESDSDLEFLLTSQPSTLNDRILCE